ncbi:MAG: hypothetical protein ABSD53_05370 [Terriglobales bacterium]|jgi:Tol biopolymer transport system component
MKKLIFTLAAAIMAVALTGCGDDSTPSPIVTYVSRASNNNSAPQLFTLNVSTKKSTAVSIPIPATAYYVASNSTATAVTYYREDATSYDIFMMGTNGTETQLTTGADAWSSTFSPDGKTIAYVASNEEIFTVNIATDTQTALYAAGLGVVYQYAPSFSPDGKSLVFYIETGDCCLSQSGRKISHRAVTPPVMKGFTPAGIHKSSHPQVGTPTQSGWYTMALTDSTPTLVYATDNWWGPAVYSGDGTKLLISNSNGESTYNILSVNLDGTNVVQLTASTSDATISPVPYKNLILYNVVNNPNSSWDIYVMSLTGTNQTLVSSTTDTYANLMDSYWGD